MPGKGANKGILRNYLLGVVGRENDVPVRVSQGKESHRGAELRGWPGTHRRLVWRLRDLPDPPGSPAEVSRPLRESERDKVHESFPSRLGLEIRFLRSEPARGSRESFIELRGKREK